MKNINPEDQDPDLEPGTNIQRGPTRGGRHRRMTTALAPALVVNRGKSPPNEKVEKGSFFVASDRQLE